MTQQTKNELPSSSTQMYLSGSLGVLFSRVVGMAAGFASLWFLTRILSTDSFAAYTFAMSLAFVLGSISGLGLERVMLLKISPIAPEAGVLHGGQLVARIALWVGTLAACSAMILIAVLYAFPGLSVQNDLLGWFPYLSPLVPAIALTSVLIAWLQSNHLVGRPQALHGQIDGLRSAGFGLVYAFGLGGFAVALSAVLASVLPPLLLAFRTARDVRPTPSQFSLADVRDGLHFFGIRSTQVAFLHADILILGVLAPAEVVAPYVVASRFALILEAGQQIFAPAYAPRVRRHVQEGTTAIAEREYHVARTLGFLSSGGAALTFVVLGKPLLDLFGNFGDAFGVLMILCAGQLVLVGAGFHSIHLSMSGHLPAALRTNLVGLATFLLLLLFLVPEMDAYGAAIAFLAAQTIVASFGLWVLYKRSRLMALSRENAISYVIAVITLVSAGLWPEQWWLAAVVLACTLFFVFWKERSLVKLIFIDLKARL